MFSSNSLYIDDINHVLQIPGIEDLRSKRVLVTGATGLIGVHLIDVFMALGDVNVMAVGRSRTKAAERLGSHYDNPLFDFIEQDVRCPFAEKIQADYIIPLASNTHPLAYSQHPVETMTINMQGAQHALELARRCDAVVLYPSTVEVYGNARGEDDFTEDYTGQLNLSTARACYTESKRSAEALCLSYASEYGVKVKIGRLSRVFGPTMLPTDTKASSQFIQKALAGADIVLKSEGRQLFSYTYVTDAVAALIHIMLHGQQAVAYNISNHLCDIRLKDFAAIAARCAGTDVIFDLPTEAERRGFSVAQRAILDNERLCGIGFIPRYDIEEAVRRTVEIMKNA